MRVYACCEGWGWNFIGNIRGGCLFKFHAIIHSIKYATSCCLSTGFELVRLRKKTEPVTTD